MVGTPGFEVAARCRSLKARKAAGLQDRIFHDFRRTGARRLINAGVSQAVAMRVTEHKTPSMFRRYQIVEKQDIAAALERVAESAGAKVVAISPTRWSRPKPWILRVSRSYSCW